MLLSKKKIFPSEKKLAVVAWFFKNGKNVSESASHFSIHRKQIRNCVEEEKLIREHKTNIKRPNNQIFILFYFRPTVGNPLCISLKCCSKLFSNIRFIRLVYCHMQWLNPTGCSKILTTSVC